MSDRAHLTAAAGPYRSPGRACHSGACSAPGWAVFVIDGSLVLVIAVIVMTIGRWPALVDVAARGFLGF
jgi:hypothetical protein